MNRIQKSLLWTSLAASLAFAAAPSFAGRDGHEGKYHDGHRYEQRMQERADALKAALQLTQAQEAAWTQFQTAMTMPKSSGKEERKAHREAFRSMDTLARLDWMKDMRSKRDAQMADRDQAIRSFYATLTNEQKQVFDSQFWMHPRGKDGKSHHDGHQKPMKGNQSE